MGLRGLRPAVAVRPDRQRLATGMDPVQLAISMWVSLEEAAGHLPPMPATEAFDRFLAWTNPG